MRALPHRFVQRATSTAALTALLLPLTAHAQGAVTDGEFSVQRFEPAMGPRNYMTVEGGRVDGSLAWSAGFAFDYANSPFVLTSCVSETNCDDPNAVAGDDLNVVEHLLTWNFMGTFTPVPWVQIGLRVPMAFALGDGLPNAAGGIGEEGISAFGLGDPTLEGKFRIFGEPTDLFVLAAAVDVAAPLGHATADGAYIGNSSPVTVGGRAIVDFDFGPVTAALNLKGVWREDAIVGSAAIGPEFRYGAGLAYEVDETFRIMAETFGASRFSSLNGTNSMEVDAGLEFKPSDMGLAFKIGGGTGVIQGVGVPLGRAFLAVSWISEGTDGDGDGIADDVDQCPTKAEDMDGLADEDGCPEDDVDRDKIADDVDKCPTEPETINGFADEDGCPDEIADSDKDGTPDGLDACPTEPGTLSAGPGRGCPDADGDGVADKFDRCPAEQEDTDGFQDTDGCLDPDNDGDGVPDAADECDGEMETMNGFQDGDGCPDAGPDQDGDGIGDAQDKCPDKPELLNGTQDDDGCPEFGAAMATVTSGQVTLDQKIAFAAEGLANEFSRNVLRAAANGLKNHQEILVVRVTVVVPQAEAAYAPQRMAAVLQLLTEQGVEPKRIKLGTEAGTPATVRFDVVTTAKR